MKAGLDAIAGFVWGPLLLIPLLLATGLYLTVVLRALQFRRRGWAPAASPPPRRRPRARCARRWCR